MKFFPFTIGSCDINQLADELVAAGVPMGGEARIERNGFPLATVITVVTQDSAVDATVNAVVAAHVPVGIPIEVGESTEVKPAAISGRAFLATDTGQLWTADGATWNPILKHVQVASLADFPTPVSGVITLTDLHAYQIIGTVDIGSNRIVCGIANIIRGVDRTNDKLVSSTTGNLFTVDGTAGTKTIFTIQDCTIQAASGSFISFTSASPNQALAILSASISGTGTLGTIHNCSSFIARNSAFATITAGGFTFTNSAAATQIAFRDNVITNCAGTLLELGTSVWATIIIGGNRITANASQTFLSGTTGGANVTVGGKLTGNVFSGAGTYVATLTNADTLWLWDSNAGVTNTAIPQADVSGLVSALAGKAASSHAHAAADVTSGQFAMARLASGTPDGTKFIRDDGTLVAPAGGGTVTTVSVTTANGVSGSVTNPASTPAIELTLGAIAPTSVSASGAVSGSNLSGTNTGDQTLPTRASIGLDTTDSPQFAGVNVGHASDTTITRVSAGVIAVEGVQLATGTGTATGTNTGDNSVNTLYSGLVSNATHTGDATGATALTIAAGAVTLAKMADIATAKVIGRTTAGTGVPEALSTTGTGNVVLDTTPTLTTPVIGAATGTSLAATGAVKSSGTAGIGYATGAGGTVTQATNKTTGVTLNKTCGQITMNGAALAAAAEVAFTLTNSTIASTDVVVVCVQSVGTAGSYFVTVGAVANGSCSITVGNCSAGSLSQAVVLNFVVLKGVAA